LSFARETGFGVKGLTFSPITGGEGNIEFLAHFVNRVDAAGCLTVEQIDALIEETVALANGNFR
jgi:23S rRNA (cytidine1920-2'-O)/16S rRNA (cytidine1409-2'-O)-methyltransferase